MAQVSFDAIPESTFTNSGNGSGVDFFNLRNDGDEAIVRFMHDSTADFKIFTVHDRVTVGGKMRKVNCIRDPKDPTEKCPLCASGRGVVNKIFINMLQYFSNEQGAIVAKPVVWERSLTYATKLKNLIDEYGPLSDCIFKIKRSGAPGSMDTTYEIFYCNPKVYRDDLYPKTTEGFNGYSALGTIILNKDYNELMTFLSTGQFPATQANNANTQAPAAPVPTYVPKPEAQQYAPPVTQVPDIPAAPFAPPTVANPATIPSVPAYPQAPAAPVPSNLPWEAPAVPTAPPAAPVAPSATPGRPPRYY